MAVLQTNPIFRRAQITDLTQAIAPAKALLQEMRLRISIRRDMAVLPDKLLRDIGLTRCDLNGATGLEMSKNAADFLNARARGRSGNW